MLVLRVTVGRWGASGRGRDVCRWRLRRHGGVAGSRPRWGAGFWEAPEEDQAGSREQPTVVPVAQRLSAAIVFDTSSLTDRGEVEHPGFGDSRVAIVKLDVQSSGRPVNVDVDDMSCSTGPGPEPKRHDHRLACPDDLLAQVDHVDLRCAVRVALDGDVDAIDRELLQCEDRVNCSSVKTAGSLTSNPGVGRRYQTLVSPR